MKSKQLKAELAEINAALAKVPALEKRRAELVGFWNTTGEIKLAELEERDSQFPIYSEGGWRKRRVVEVNEKYVVLRDDGSKDDDVQKYRREDGRHFRRKYDQIDVGHALKVWEENKQIVP